MMLVSGTVQSRASSISTGIVPMGQSSKNSRREVSSPKWTMCGSNGVLFSYSAISTFWLNDDSGWK